MVGWRLERVADHQAFARSELGGEEAGRPAVVTPNLENVTTNARRRLHREHEGEVGTVIDIEPSRHVSDVLEHVDGIESIYSDLVQRTRVGGVWVISGRMAFSTGRVKVIDEAATVAAA